MTAESGIEASDTMTMNHDIVPSPVFRKAIIACKRRRKPDLREK